MSDQKPITISYSKVTTFKSCPQKYYLNQEYPEEMTSSALPFGKAVEAGIDVLIGKKPLSIAKAEFAKWWREIPPSKWGGSEKVFDSPDIFYYANDYDPLLLTEEDKIQVLKWKEEILPDLDLTWDKLVSKFQGQVSDNSFIHEDERKFAHRVIWLCCLRRGEIMLEAFERELLPEIEEVLGSQESIMVTAPEGDKVRGYIDYVMRLNGYDEPVVVDLKTAGKFYSEHDLNTSDQLGIYSAAKNMNYIAYMVVLKSIKHEKSCAKCGHIRENSRKTNCEKCEGGKYTKVTSKGATQLLVRKVRESEKDDVVADFGDVALAIKNHVNWKNPGSCFDFNKKCTYYDYCWGSKKLEDLVGIKKK